MWRPKSSQSAATSCWTSETFASLPLLSSFRPKKPSFPNKMQNVISSEKRTLDLRATVQLFLFSVQVRGFWCCLWFRFALRNVTAVSTFLKTFASDGFCEVLPSSWIDFSWPLIRFDALICEQPAFSATTFCVYPCCGGCQWLSSGQLWSQQSSSCTVCKVAKRYMVFIQFKY